MVTELARNFPDSCLNIKVFSQTTDKSSTLSSEITSHITERSRALTSSELLVLVGDVGAGQQQRFLRCLDSRDDNVYQPMDMQAKFSAFTKEDNQQDISGVHRIRALLNKRLPLTVRMVSGSPQTELKIGQHLCYKMRLLASFREKMGGSNGKTADGGVVIIAPNMSLKQSKEFARMTSDASTSKNSSGP